MMAPEGMPAFTPALLGFGAGGKLTVEQGGQHQPKHWGERFSPAVSFLFPHETEIKSLACVSRVANQYLPSNSSNFRPSARCQNMRAATLKKLT